MAPLIPIFAAVGGAAAGVAGGAAAMIPTLISVGTAVAGAVMTKQQQDEMKRQTVAPVGTVKSVEGSLTSQDEKEKEQRRRMRQAQAVMLKDWESPVLGFPGLLGISGG